MKHIQVWRLRQSYRELLRMIRSISRNPAARDQAPDHASDLLRRKDELRRAMMFAELGLQPVPVRRRR
ncbi:MAG: hypothetical protein H2041_12235 [Phenylobacterium sp.]|uniref:hypothetical protein n=1 Tax=unclassified Phenylobacterium TaxID=2640670 RepID=UPI0008B70C76|nr:MULTISPECIES: hypothetical protein [unclassified Phenylobacterium]MBA4794426.1 hypothetical protein [Phenylobacterium sp.]OHB28628.1 MAG: hypothetical protein A2790_08690 [Phenylobacterium sp. RIFCSPHIGHO2_01_FULL_69_31]